MVRMFSQTPVGWGVNWKWNGTSYARGKENAVEKNETRKVYICLLGYVEDICMCLTTERKRLWRRGWTYRKGRIFETWMKRIQNIVEWPIWRGYGVEETKMMIDTVPFVWLWRELILESWWLLMSLWSRISVTLWSCVRTCWIRTFAESKRVLK